MDPFSDEQVELQALVSKPSCFVILGKPGSGRTTLARRLAASWRCKLVDGATALKQSMDDGTELGREVESLLIKGESVPEDLVAQAIVDKIVSLEISHHGYVLDCLPCGSETWKSIDDQLAFIESLPMKPDFIINMRIPDADLKRRRLGLKVDPVTGLMFTEAQYSGPHRQTDDDEEEDDENGGSEEGDPEESEERDVVGEPDDIDPLPFQPLANDVCQRLTKRPEDKEPVVMQQLQWYHDNILRKVEDFMAAWDRQKLVELDANQAPEELYKQLMIKLRSDGLHPACVPLPLIDADADDDDEEDADVDEMLHHLANSHNMGQGCRWRQSRWKEYCPVELQAGNLVKGKSRFAVSFLDKIYCLSSGVALQQFMRCPRLYVMPPQPRPTCKISVCGPSMSGKSTISALLAEKYNAKLLDLDELVKPLYDVVRNEQLQKARADAIHNAIQTVTAAEAARAAQSHEDEASSLGDDVESSGISLPDISEDHPDVLASVQMQMIEAEKIETPITDSMFVEAVKQGIMAVEKAHEERGTPPTFGGWVIDGFPRNKDQWMIVSEQRNLLPDDIIFLQDSSEGFKLLAERYKSLKQGDNPPEETATKQEETGKDAAHVGADGEVDSGEKKQDDLPKEDPIVEEYRKQRVVFDGKWTLLSQSIKGFGVDPLVVDANQTVHEVLKSAMAAVEKRFQYLPREYTQDDEQEDEEDAEAEIPIDERVDDDDEQDEDAALKDRKPWGETRHYCPVALQEQAILWPGNPELACKYKERVYQFSTQESKDKFMRDPTAYLPSVDPIKLPPLRLLILGAKGAGKTEQGRTVAKELGIFHIDFCERLQEMIIEKTGKRVNREEGAEQVEEDESAEDKPELTEDEEAIQSYLSHDVPLAESQLISIIKPWWHEEPLKSTGFVLEGIPNTPDEMQMMANEGLFADMAVMLTIQEKDVINRLLPGRVARWRAKRDERVAKREKERKERMKERKEAREILKKEKTEEFNKQWQERKKAAEEAENDSDEENEELPDYHEALQDFLDEEMPEEEEEEEEDDEDETEEDAVERMRSDLSEKYDDDTSHLSQVMESLDDLRVSRANINASRKPSIVRYSIRKSLEKVVERRQSILTRCLPVDVYTAKALLASGYKQPSKFRRWCPVDLKNDAVVPRPQGPSVATYPVVYRQHVYYLSSVEARRMFVHDPVSFLDQPAPGQPVPMKLSIIGPPKSGKSHLANRLEQEFGCVRLSIGKALRQVMEMQPDSELAKQINSFVKSGVTVPDEVAVEALQVALLNVQCQTRGYVLDGYPMTKHQIELMTERKIIPVRVIELDVPEDQIVSRGKKDREDPNRSLPLHDSDSILRIRYGCYQKEVGDVTQWYSSQHHNYCKVNAARSKWFLWEQVLNIMKCSVNTIRSYLARVKEGRAVCIADLCVTPHECLSRLGEYTQFCPVSLNRRGELFDCSIHDSLKYTAEYNGHYYRMSSAEDLQSFLDTPDDFCGPNAPRQLPPKDKLPRRRTEADVKAMFPKQVELQGYCPVTYQDGDLRYEYLVPGEKHLVVEYCKKLYIFASEDKLQKFLRLPEQYANLRLPKKLPPIRNPFPVRSLPMLGYMEQTVADAIIKALTAVGCQKPKYPFLTAQRSAQLYVAYHLKAFNPCLSEYTRQKYKNELARFEEHCELTTYLGGNMDERYRPPEERPIDFDFKMRQFLALKGQEPHVR